MAALRCVRSVEIDSSAIEELGLSEKESLIHLKEAVHLGLGSCL
jgi:hypothetical protein